MFGRTKFIMADVLSAYLWNPSLLTRRQKGIHKVIIVVDHEGPSKRNCEGLMIGVPFMNIVIEPRKRNSCFWGGGFLEERDVPVVTGQHRI